MSIKNLVVMIGVGLHVSCSHVVLNLTREIKQLFDAIVVAFLTKISIFSILTTSLHISIKSLSNNQSKNSKASAPPLCSRLGQLAEESLTCTPKWRTWRTQVKLAYKVAYIKSRVQSKLLEYF